MNKKRSSEYDKRDLMFAHSCEKCSRARWCAFKTSPEGPEEVCRQLIEGGTYNCESCIRYMKNGGCTFQCVFFRPKPLDAGDSPAVIPMTPEQELRFRNSYCAIGNCVRLPCRMDRDQQPKDR